MTMMAVSAVIALFCQFDGTNVKANFKWDCMDYMVNCVVNKEGEIVKEDVIRCENKFDKGSRYVEQKN